MNRMSRRRVGVLNLGAIVILGAAMCWTTQVITARPLLAAAWALWGAALGAQVAVLAQCAETDTGGGSPCTGEFPRHPSMAGIKQNGILGRLLRDFWLVFAEHLV